MLSLKIKLNFEAPFSGVCSKGHGFQTLYHQGFLFFPGNFPLSYVASSLNTVLQGRHC